MVEFRNLNFQSLNAIAFLLFYLYHTAGSQDTHEAHKHAQPYKNSKDYVPGSTRFFIPKPYKKRKKANLGDYLNIAFYLVYEWNSCVYESLY